MQVLGNLMHHVQLVSRMARATQTNLVEAFEAGDLSQNDWAKMVQTCRNCNWAGDCPDWLNRHNDISDAPENCLNRRRFAALKTREREEKESRIGRCNDRLGRD